MAGDDAGRGDSLKMWLESGSGRISMAGSLTWNPQKTAFHRQQVPVARNDLQKFPNFPTMGLSERHLNRSSKARFERVFVCLEW
jgi:hypothetical protein